MTVGFGPHRVTVKERLDVTEADCHGSVAELCFSGRAERGAIEGRMISVGGFRRHDVSERTEGATLEGKACTVKLLA